MTCPSCNSSPTRICPTHAMTDNHTDDVDLELERLREEVAELRQQRNWLGQTLREVEEHIQAARSLQALDCISRALSPKKETT